MPKSFKRDLTWEKFGRLVVMSWDEAKSKVSAYNYWLCQCSCEQQKVVSVAQTNLLSGASTSCGCYRREVISRPNKFKILSDGSVEVYANNTGSTFLVDYADFLRIKAHAWVEICGGYFMARVNGRNVRLHRFILNCTSDTEEIDHIASDRKFDHRRSNLRTCTHQQNSQNRKRKLGKSGYHPNVCQNPNGTFMVRVSNKYFGTFSDVNVAVAAAEAARQQMFGEFAPNYNISPQDEPSSQTV